MRFGNFVRQNCVKNTSFLRFSNLTSVIPTKNISATSTACLSLLFSRDSPEDIARSAAQYFATSLIYPQVTCAFSLRPPLLSVPSLDTGEEAGPGLSGLAPSPCSHFLSLRRRLGRPSRRIIPNLGCVWGGNSLRKGEEEGTEWVGRSRRTQPHK